MNVLLPVEIEKRLIVALKRAGRREIGGILMGECLAANCFRIVNVTIQYQGGSFATFLRQVRLALNPLKHFFEKTNHNYRRFNYLGEWHSHPSFALVPSGPDIRSMLEIIEDPQVGATFAILMIIRLRQGEVLEGTITIFTPGQPAFQGNLIMESISA